MQTLITGLAFGESLRWHEDRLWMCDWGAGQILAVDSDGTVEVTGAVRNFGACIDWLPDGRLLTTSGDGRLGDGFAELGPAAWNEIVVDPTGNVYVNCIGFAFPQEEFRPGYLVAVTPDGTVTRVADGFGFPNGMAVTPDGRTLIVAESYQARLTAFDLDGAGGVSNRRTWASLAEGAAPDGICLAADGTVWYADVPNKACVHVREGGDIIDTITFDQGCFDCTLGGDDGRTLFVTTTAWNGPDTTGAARTGRVLQGTVT